MMRDYIMNAACFVYYVCASVTLIPAILRIFRRKESSDYSKAGVCFGMTGTIAYAVYIYSSSQIPLMYIGAAYDLLLYGIHTYAVLKYHDKKGA